MKPNSAIAARGVISGIAHTKPVPRNLMTTKMFPTPESTTPGMTDASSFEGLSSIPIELFVLGFIAVPS